MFCATREQAIRNHLEQLIKQRPNVDKFPIYVSQDSDNAGVTHVIQEFVTKEKNVHHMRVINYWFIKMPPFSIPNLLHRQQLNGRLKNYYYISQHYKWALQQIFNVKNHSTAIITEGYMSIPRASIPQNVNSPKNRNTVFCREDFLLPKHSTFNLIQHRFPFYRLLLSDCSLVKMVQYVTTEKGKPRYVRL